MIDRIRRDRLAESLRHFVDGLLTNHEFEDRLDKILDDPRPVRQWEDKALWAVRTRAWFLYDDLRTRRMKGKRSLTPAGRSVIARWIVFLHSDYEYEWPIGNFVSLTGCLLRIVTVGLAPIVYGWMKREEIKAMGDWAVWPFIRRADFEQAVKRPRLLSGRA